MRITSGKDNPTRFRHCGAFSFIMRTLDREHIDAYDYGVFLGKGTS